MLLDLYTTSTPVCTLESPLHAKIARSRSILRYLHTHTIDCWLLDCIDWTQLFERPPSETLGSEIRIWLVAYLSDLNIWTLMKSFLVRVLRYETSSPKIGRPGIIEEAMESGCSLYFCIYTRYYNSPISIDHSILAHTTVSCQIVQTFWLDPAARAST